MRTSICLVAAVAAVLVLSGCKSNKNTSQTQGGGDQQQPLVQDPSKKMTEDMKKSTDDMSKKMDEKLKGIKIPGQGGQGGASGGEPAPMTPPQ